MRSAVVCDAPLWIKCCVIDCAAKEAHLELGQALTSPQHRISYIMKTLNVSIRGKESSVISPKPVYTPLNR